MRVLLGVLALATVLLQFRLWLSDDGVREVARLSNAVDAQEANNKELRARNAQLAAEVQDLKKGLAALEERARSELGMVANNETFFQVVPRVLPLQDAERTRTALR